MTITLPRLGLRAALARALYPRMPRGVRFMVLRLRLYRRGWQAVNTLRFLNAAREREARDGAIQ